MCKTGKIDCIALFYVYIVEARIYVSQDPLHHMVPGYGWPKEELTWDQEDEVKQKSLLLVDRHVQTRSWMTMEMSGSFSLSFLSSIPHLSHFPSNWP